MKYMIVDFNNILHQSHVPWTYEDPSDTNNGLILSFFQLLAKFVREFEIDSMVIAVEGSPKHRYALSDDYKAGRGKPRNDKWDHFKRQLRIIQSMLTKMFACVVIRHENLEADDSIYEAVQIFLKTMNEDDELIVFSSDTDLIQLLGDPRVKLWAAAQKKYREPSEVDYVSMKALIGDRSDEIVGVRGIGPKKAEKIVREGVEDYLQKNDEFREIYERNLKMIRLKRWSEIEGKKDVRWSKWNFSATRLETLMNSLGIYRSIEKMVDSYSKLKLPNEFLEKILKEVDEEEKTDNSTTSEEFVRV